MQIFKRIIQKSLNTFGYSIYRNKHDISIQVTLKMLVGQHLLDYPEVRFIQVGAYDGRSDDPLHELIIGYPMRGILLEPQKSVFHKLQANYEGHGRVTLVNAAIADTNGEAALFKIDERAVGPEWLPQLATFSKSTLLKHKSHVPDLEAHIETELVKTVTPNSLVEQYNFQEFDLLVIDTEGYDFQILQLFEQFSLLPPIILFESKHLEHEYQLCIDFLVHRTYQLTSCGPNMLAYSYKNNIS